MWDFSLIRTILGYIFCALLMLAITITLPTLIIGMIYPKVDTSPSIPGNLEQRDFLLLCDVVVFTIGILGIFGNSFSISAVLRSSRVQSAARAFIISLCVADLVFCALNLPLAVASFTKQRWFSETAPCILMPFLRYFNVGLSLLTLAALAVNRCILIVKPAFYQKVYKTRYIAVIIIFLWFLSIGILTPSLLDKWGRFGYDPEILTCTLMETGGNSAKITWFVIELVVPCLIVVFCYGCIFWVVRKDYTRILSSNKSPSIVSDHRDTDTEMVEEEMEITRMVLFVFSAFLLYCVPIVVVKAIDPKISTPEAHITGFLLLYLRAAVNPVIYAIADKRYREAYKAILRCKELPTTGNREENLPGTHPREAIDLIADIPLVTFPINLNSDNELLQDERV